MKQFLHYANNILFSINSGLLILLLAVSIYAPFVFIWCGNLFIWICNIPFCIGSFGIACSVLPQMSYTWFSTQYWLATAVYFICGGWMVPILIGTFPLIAMDMHERNKELSESTSEEAPMTNYTNQMISDSEQRQRINALRQLSRR